MYFSHYFPSHWNLFQFFFSFFSRLFGHAFFHVPFDMGPVPLVITLIRWPGAINLWWKQKRWIYRKLFKWKRNEEKEEAEKMLKRTEQNNFSPLFQPKKKIYRIQFMPKTGGCETTVNKHRFIEKYSMVRRHNFSFSFSALHRFALLCSVFKLFLRWFLLPLSSWVVGKSCLHIDAHGEKKTHIFFILFHQKS